MTTDRNELSVIEAEGINRQIQDWFFEVSFSTFRSEANAIMKTIRKNTVAYGCQLEALRLILISCEIAEDADA